LSLFVVEVSALRITAWWSNIEEKLDIVELKIPKFRFTCFDTPLFFELEQKILQVYSLKESVVFLDVAMSSWTGHVLQYTLDHVFANFELLNFLLGESDLIDDRINFVAPLFGYF
jgi:hypothetical protein